MTIPLRVVGRPNGEGTGTVRHSDPEKGWWPDVQPGDCWREPILDTSDRAAWCIVLPNREVWCTTDAVPESGMWDVHGEVPSTLTVSPSINCLGEHPWHGWIRHGQLEV